MRSITTILDFRQTEGQPQIFCTVTSNQSSWILLPGSLVLSQGWGLIDLLLRASNEALLRARVPRAQEINRLHPLPSPASEVLRRGLAPARASDTVDLYINGVLDSVMEPVVGLEGRRVAQQGRFVVRPKILIIDDSVDSWNLLNTIVKSHNFYPVWAADGMQAMAAARFHHPQAILLDLGLPGGHLRREDPAVEHRLPALVQ